MNHRLTILSWQGDPRMGVASFFQSACDCGWFAQRPGVAREALEAYRDHLPKEEA